MEVKSTEEPETSDRNSLPRNVSGPLKQLDLVTVRIGHKSHLAACRQGRPPISRPDLITELFQFVTFGDKVRISDRCMHEIFGHLGHVIRRIAELKPMGISRNLEKNQLIAFRRSVVTAGDPESKRLIKGHGPVNVTNPNASVEKFRHAAPITHTPIGASIFVPGGCLRGCLGQRPTCQAGPHRLRFRP